MKSVKLSVVEIGPRVAKDCGLRATEVRVETDTSTASSTAVIQRFICRHCLNSALANVNNACLPLSSVPFLSLGNANQKVIDAVTSEIGTNRPCGEMRPEKEW